MNVLLHGRNTRVYVVRLLSVPSRGIIFRNKSGTQRNIEIILRNDD